MDAGVVAVGISIAGGVATIGLYVIRSEMKGDVIRLDGRINAHEDACEQRQEKLDERHVVITRTLEAIAQTQRDMHEKIDRLVGR